MFQSELTLVLSLLASGSAYLLGAGEGMGRFVDINDEIIFVFIYNNLSCAAYPFRAVHVYWSKGCPHHAPCCSEFGYCRPRVRQSLTTVDIFR